MGITLGWVALLLAGATGAPPEEKHTAAISYTVKMVEADGVGWRASAMSQLKPVTRQGAATVWTLPRSASKNLIQEITKSSSDAVVQGPRVMALPGVPATIQVRENRKFVTQVAWNGEDSAPQAMPEDVRIGWHTTLIGRKLDQGILVKMVLEDTEIRGVYQVTMASPSDAKVMKTGVSVPGMFRGTDKLAGAHATVFDDSPFETSGSSTVTKVNASCDNDASQAACAGDAAKKTKMKDLMDKAMTAYADGEFTECESLAKRVMELDPDELAAATLVFKARTERRFKADKNRLNKTESGFLRALKEVDRARDKADRVLDKVDHLPALEELQARRENRLLELPEIANQEILGEWLIPKGECLLVSFGPHTVADKDGKAVVRERLAFVEAEEQAGVAGAPRAVTAVPSYIIRMAPGVAPPPAPFGAVPPGPPVPPAPAPIAPPTAYSPTPVPDPAGPLPSGRYMHDDVQYFPSGPDFPWANTQAATQRARMRAQGVEPPSPPAAAPIPAAPARSAEKLPVPPAPSRSFPEGIHADGRKAKLPPLPDDEIDEADSADSESAEPRPSPQTKKPRKPEPKPEADESTTKASFTQPKSSTVFLPSLFLPGASTGFQFLLPIRPLSLKLPFNQRLEIEIFGRVVPDAQPSEVEKTPAVAPLSSRRPAVDERFLASRVMEAMMAQGVKWMLEPSTSTSSLPEKSTAEVPTPAPTAGCAATPGRATGTSGSSIQQTVDSLLSQAQQLQKQADHWETFWLLDQPSQMTPYRIDK
jgi:hypothetical protein